MRSPFLFVMFTAAAPLFAQQAWTLEQCVQRAEERNLTIQRAQYDRDGAFQDERAGKWGLFPDLNAAATHGYNWGQTIDRYTNEFATDRVRTNNLWLGSSWTLYGGMARQNQWKQAKLNTASAEEALAAARIDVRSQVVSFFMQMLSAEERIKAATNTVERTREQVVLTEALVQAGRTARVELLDLRAQQAREEFDLVTAENQYQQARLQLAQLLQFGLAEMEAFSITAPALSSFEPQEPTVTVEQVMQRVRESHPSYKRTELDVQSAEKGVEIARATGIPSLQFSANIASGFSGLNEVPVGEPIYGTPSLVGYTSGGEDVFVPNVSYNTEVKGFGDQLKDNVNYSTAWTLNVPIFNNMRNRTGVQQARIRYERARLQQTDIEQQLRLTVQQAIADQRASYRQYMAASNAVEAAQESMSYAKDRFEQGAVTALELSTAKTNLNRSMADMITARYNYVLATKSLEILQGMPLTL